MRRPLQVLAGVALTNLPGVAVLAFAKAQLIHIFFFRLNFAITVLGAAHGVAFLPVLLSYVGTDTAALRSRTHIHRYIHTQIHAEI